MVGNHETLQVALSLVKNLNEKYMISYQCILELLFDPHNLILKY